MKGKIDMWMIILYAVMSASALTFVKFGANKAMGFKIDRGILDVQINMFAIIGLFMYIISFILGIIAMSKTNLNVFYPVSAGLAYVLICLLSYFFLKESISANQIVGMIIIFCGVVFINIGR